ncbi:MAG: phosphodiesterase, MJ0936 family, partial [uncultured Thermomicrobiales bacterium]
DRPHRRLRRPPRQPRRHRGDPGRDRRRAARRRLLPGRSGRLRRPPERDGRPRPGMRHPDGDGQLRRRGRLRPRRVRLRVHGPQRGGPRPTIPAVDPRDDHRRPQGLPADAATGGPVRGRGAPLPARPWQPAADERVPLRGPRPPLARADRPGRRVRRARLRPHPQAVDAGDRRRPLRQRRQRRQGEGRRPAGLLGAAGGGGRGARHRRVSPGGLRYRRRGDGDPRRFRAAGSFRARHRDRGCFL